MSDGTDIESSGKAFDGGVPIQLSEMLDKLLANPQILSSVASALASSQGQTAQAPPENAVQTSVRQDPSLDAVADKLPEIMNMLRPMISPSVSSSKSDGGGKKEALLCAVKPYLSDGRREAVDYIIKLSRIAEILKKMS